MDALDVLQQRVSCPLLEAPGPTQVQLEQMLKAALRAPDHANLKPSRFIVIEGKGRQRLGELFVQAALAKKPELSEADQEKTRNKPLRAPTIIVVTAATQEHPKVPRIEQVVTAGAAANNIVTAAYAMGIGAYWRTGGVAFDAVVKQGLGVAEHDEILGFLYLGTPKVTLRDAPELPLDEVTEYWR